MRERVGNCGRKKKSHQERVHDQRLREEFEVGCSVAQEGLWKIARKRILEEKKRETSS